MRKYLKIKKEDLYPIQIDYAKELKILLDRWNYEAKFWNAKAELCRGSASEKCLIKSEIYKQCIKELKEKL